MFGMHAKLLDLSEKCPKITTVNEMWSRVALQWWVKKITYLNNSLLKKYLLFVKKMLDIQQMFTL